jgi:hypothetical protein
MELYAFVRRIISPHLLHCLYVGRPFHAHRALGAASIGSAQVLMAVSERVAGSERRECGGREG